MRVTNHNMRVPSARHNDRDFDVAHAHHIEPAKVKQNRYWACYKDCTFEEAERIAYSKLFTAGLDAANSRHLKNRHPDHVRDMDTYRTSKQTCPEETLYYVGNKQDLDRPDPDMLWGITLKLLHWQQQTYPQCKILDIALHMDEQGAPHVHARQVWIAHDHDGNNIVSQTKALREMGVERPYPGEKQGRYNNPKQTFTAAVRSKYMALAMEHGLDVDILPRDASKSGVDHLTYQARKAQEELARTQAQIKALQRSKEQLQTDVDWLVRGSGLRALDPDWAREQDTRIREHLQDAKDCLDR